MNILFITHRFYPDIGGIEVNSEILANSFHKAGHSVKLITWTAASGEKLFPFKVIRQPTISLLFKEHQWADVVFENNPCLRLSWPSIFFKKQSVVALRTWVRRMDGEMGWQDKFKLLWLKRTSAVIAVSEAIRRATWPQAVVIGNPYRDNLFRTLSDSTHTSDFVFMGRLVSDKGVDIAIRAIHRLFIESPTTQKYSLTIIGEGPERQNLEAMVNDLNLSEHITFTGSLRGDALVACLNKHRFLLVPSLWEEPFGNVALEGMACGCLPIVSDGGGLPDAVGKAGLTFARGNVDSLVACIQKVLANPDLEQQLRDAAETHLASHRPDVVSRRYLDVIESAFVKA